MTQRVKPTHRPLPPGRHHGRDNISLQPPAFLNHLSSRLLPVEGWGSFRPGSRPAAVTLLLHEDEGAWQVPFVVRRDDSPSHPGQVALPGGMVREGEEAWPAAARECEEEIGVAASRLVPLGAGRSLYAAVTNFTVVPFVAWLPGPAPTFVPQASELDAVLEVSLERLLDPAAWLAGPEPWSGPHLPVAGTMIWGLTARLLAGLLPLVRAASLAVSGG